MWEFNDHDPKACTDEIVIKAISRFKHRQAKVQIPHNVQYRGARIFPMNT